MHVQTQFTFGSVNEYARFCAHFAIFKQEEIRPSDPAPKVEVDSPIKKTEEVKGVQKAEAQKPKKAQEEKPAAPEPEKAEAKIETLKAQKEEVKTSGVVLKTEPTYENVKEAILAVANAYKSKTAAVKILNTYGLEKVKPDMPSENFADIIADCQAALDNQG